MKRYEVDISEERSEIYHKSFIVTADSEEFAVKEAMEKAKRGISDDADLESYDTKINCEFLREMDEDEPGE